MKTNESYVIRGETMALMFGGMSVIILALITVALCPLAYLWIMGTVGSVALLFGSLVVCGSLFSNGTFLDHYFAWKLMEGTFQLIAVIFIGLAQASAGSSD